jgi:hypothetical protein
MHTLSSIGLVVATLFAAGCGGGATPRASGPTEAAAVPDASAPAVSTTGESTTTASLPYDGGAGQGTKLPLLSDASDAGAGAPDGGGRRTHEPGRGPDDIRAAVVARRAETRSCFEKASAAPGGRSLTMQWTIDPKGNVGAPSLDASRSDVTDPEVVHCIAEIVKSIKFAASPGGYETKASYPFILHRQRNGDAGGP